MTIKTTLDQFLSDVLAGRAAPLPEHDGERLAGEKTVAERKARARFYGQVYDPQNFRPVTPRAP